jgi:hypothetical protein
MVYKASPVINRNYGRSNSYLHRIKYLYILILYFSILFRGALAGTFLLLLRL